MVKSSHKKYMLNKKTLLILGFVLILGLIFSFFQAVEAIDIATCSKYFPERECNEIEAELMAREGPNAFVDLTEADFIKEYVSRIDIGRGLPWIPVGGEAGIVERAINYLFWFTLVAVTMIIVLGAIAVMKSGGVPEKAQKGKKMIVWALIGFIIMLAIKLIMSVVEGILG